MTIKNLFRAAKRMLIPVATAALGLFASPADAANTSYTVFSDADYAAIQTRLSVEGFNTAKNYHDYPDVETRQEIARNFQSFYRQKTNLTIAVDSIFGSQSEKAEQTFLKANVDQNLVIDGVDGPQTQAARNKWLQGAIVVGSDPELTLTVPPVAAQEPPQKQDYHSLLVKTGFPLPVTPDLSTVEKRRAELFSYMVVKYNASLNFSCAMIGNSDIEDPQYDPNVLGPSNALSFWQHLDVRSAKLRAHAGQIGQIDYFKVPDFVFSQELKYDFTGLNIHSRQDVVSLTNTVQTVFEAPLNIDALRAPAGVRCVNDLGPLYQAIIRARDVLPEIERLNKITSPYVVPTLVSETGQLPSLKYTALNDPNPFASLIDNEIPNIVSTTVTYVDFENTVTTAGLDFSNDADASPILAAIADSTPNTIHAMTVNLLPAHKTPLSSVSAIADNVTIECNLSPDLHEDTFKFPKLFEAYLHERDYGRYNKPLTPAQINAHSPSRVMLAANTNTELKYVEPVLTASAPTRSARRAINVASARSAGRQITGDGDIGTANLNRGECQRVGCPTQMAAGPR